MHWQDHAIILSTRKYGENAALVQCFSHEHGVYRAMVRGITGKRNRGLYQAGNLVEATWKARLSEQLGTLTAELSRSYAATLMADDKRLTALCSALALVEQMLPEREPHPHMFSMLVSLLESLQMDEGWAEDYVRFELELLQELGFGLDLSCCAATGEVEDLYYVSPKSGRAVSRKAGAPYCNKLLPLPGFLLGNPMGTAENQQKIKNGLALTGFFLNKYILEPHGWKMPAMRVRLAVLLTEYETTQMTERV